MNLWFSLRNSAFGGGLYKAMRAVLPPLRIRRKVWGLDVFFDLRDCLFYLAMTREQLEHLEGPVLDLIKKTDGPVWDIGCNVGLFSLYCAKQGRPVTAFDISDKCIRLLESSAKANGLSIQTVPTALSMEPFEFTAPTSAHTMNAVKRGSSEGLLKQSITLHDAAERFGIPKLIKMDIEGAEMDFFRSAIFKQWIQDHRVSLLVEMHSGEIWDAAWDDLPFEKVDDRHIFYHFS